MSSQVAQAANTDKVDNPIQPIVLTTPIKPEETVGRRSQRGFLSTLAVLFAGWFLGNLILFSLLGVGALTFASSTGLVKVPFLTSYFFGEATPAAPQVDSYSLHNAQEKIEKIQSLGEGESINSLVFYEDEINALLASKTQEDPSFPVVWQNLSLLDSEFVFTGLMSETNAPVLIKGRVSTQGLSGEIEITEAKYGKITIPSFLATNIVESQLSSIGFSLSGNKIPARALQISQGLLRLTEVTAAQ